MRPLWHAADALFLQELREPILNGERERLARNNASAGFRFPSLAPRRRKLRIACALFILKFRASPLAPRADAIAFPQDDRGNRFRRGKSSGRKQRFCIRLFPTRSYDLAGTPFCKRRNVAEMWVVFFGLRDRLSTCNQSVNKDVKWQAVRTHQSLADAQRCDRFGMRQTRYFSKSSASQYSTASESDWQEIMLLQGSDSRRLLQKSPTSNGCR